MPFSKVRTRIAPSPTGDPHVGTAYIALFNYCFARKHGGDFILRIEDTDTERSSAESEAAILNSLRWLGLQWDEGPETGGPFGPYRQSERGEIYRKYADQLLADGRAFRCFCTPERLSAMRDAQRAAGARPGYDGHCLALTADEAAARADAGEPFVIRMKIPREGSAVIKDLLRGEIVIGWDTVDMQVLLKADGMPTYHLANVVDDHLMQISHILRGEEWINSAPKHQLLYEYFGWEMPALCHLPLLRNPDKSKLSKRKNPTSLLFYDRMGYLPEALLNYLGLMAWSMPGGKEKFSLAAMVEQFSLERISLGGPVFDLTKLNWLNGRWIREDLSAEQFTERVRRWAVNEEYMQKLVPLVRSRISVLSDLGPLAAPFFSGIAGITLPQLLDGKLSQDEISVALHLALARADDLEWKKEEIEKALKGMADEMKIKPRDFLRPFFIVITGSPVSVPLFDAMEILGRDLCRARLRNAVELVGKPRDEEKKRWLKERL
ncbi:MAG: glutamate--tRNA ligase [Acidobacteriota bacterium]|nr:glutamate--tRNA ligase [Acidobacteriota bacterium]